MADQYYFELSYGDRMEFLAESHLAGAPIANSHFKSILRIEVPPVGYKSFKVPDLAHRATVTWNPAKTLALAAFTEYAVILTPQFHLVSVYRNMSGARWSTDNEIVATVEVGGPVSKYDTEDFVLNIQTERVRRVRQGKR